MREYDTSEPIRFEAQSAPEVVETVEIEGQPVAIVRYATLLAMPTADATPVFGRTDEFYAMFAGAEVHTLSRAFYVNKGRYHEAGQGTGGHAIARVKSGELARAATVKGAIKAARDRIERDRLFVTYAPVAVANIGSHTRADFEALDADAEIEPGDLVVVLSHSQYRTGVAVKVTRTRVECLAATPTGGRANGATRTKGTQVRLLRKATPATPAEQAEQGEVATATPAAPTKPHTFIPEWGTSAAGGACQLRRPAPCGKRYGDPVHAAAAAATARALSATPDAAPAAPAAPALDEAEERRAVAGWVFASMQGMDDAGAVCTLYRMVRARVGERQIRIHDAAGELLGMVTEGADGWQAETPAGEGVPMFLGALPGGMLGGFADVVDAVRAAAAEQLDDQGATVAAREGEDMGQTEAPAGEPGRDAVDALLALVREHGIDPATLRAVADQVERDRAGHVTEIEVDGAGHFAWRCLLGDAEQTGLEVGETAYAAATAHGPLAADSPFVRGPVIVHEGRGDNERGVPRRTLAGSLRFEPFDGGFWFLSGYASTDEIEEEDEGIVAAQSWAAGLMAHPGYGEPSAVVVARWEHHRDDYGDWWEPVIR